MRELNTLKKPIVVDDVDLPFQRTSSFINEVLALLSEGEIYSYEEFKSFPINFQARFFLLIDKEFSISQVAKIWGVSENTVYQWRHRIKKYISKNEPTLVEDIKHEIGLSKSLSKYKKESVSTQTLENIQLETQIVDREVKEVREDIEENFDLYNLEIKHGDCPSKVLKTIIQSLLELKELDKDTHFDVSIHIKEVK
jgi:transposase